MRSVVGVVVLLGLGCGNGSGSDDSGGASTATTGGTAATSGGPGTGGGSGNATTADDGGGSGGSGGATTGGAADTGAASTGAADGGTSSGGNGGSSGDSGGVCDPSSQPNDCLACVATPCCNQLAQCMDDTACACIIDCHVVQGKSIGNCKSQCSAADDSVSLYNGVYFCGQMTCLNTCDWSVG